MYPPGSDEPYDGGRMARFMDVDREYYVMKMNTTVSKKSRKTVLKNRLG